MKKISLLIIALVAISSVLRAQDVKKDSVKGPKITILSFDIQDKDSWNCYMSEDENGNKKFFSKRNNRYRFDGHWAGFELGFTRFTDAPKDFLELSKSKSSQVNLNIIETSFSISENFGFVTGLGIQWNNYRFSNDVTLVKFIDHDGDKCYTQFPINKKDKDVLKTKLTTTYLTVPLLLEFQSKYNRGKFFQFGIVGGFNIGSHTKIKYGNGDKDKNFDDFGIKDLKCDGTVRLGISPFNIWFSYSFTDIFKDDNLFNNSTGEYLNVSPWSFGFSIFF